MNTKSPLFHIMSTAVQKAGRALVRDFGEVEQLQVSLKGPVDFSTKASRKAENIIRNELLKVRPRYGFVTRELDDIEGSDISNFWIVDPMNGHVNFLHGIPHFCISVALERDRRIEAALIYHPIADELYFAERGQGAFLNDRRLRVSSRNKLNDAVFANNFSLTNHIKDEGYASEHAKLLPQCTAIRSMGSIALDLAYVAAGRFDGCWESCQNKWDIAAGILIVKEAGGIVIDFKGTNKMLQFGEIIASNASLDQQLRNTLKPVCPSKLSKSVVTESTLEYSISENGLEKTKST